MINATEKKAVSTQFNLIENFRNVDIENDLINRLNSQPDTNQCFEGVVKQLIFYLLQRYFLEYKDIKIDSKNKIYSRTIFGKSPKPVADDILDKYDILFPYPETSSRILTLLAINIIWLGAITVLIYKYPLLIIFGVKIISAGGILLLFLPVIILSMIFPKYFYVKRFGGISNFEELIEKLLVLNFWKYKTDDYKRLKNELICYFQNHPKTLSHE